MYEFEISECSRLQRNAISEWGGSVNSKPRSKKSDKPKSSEESIMLEVIESIYNRKEVWVMLPESEKQKILSILERRL